MPGKGEGIRCTSNKSSESHASDMIALDAGFAALAGFNSRIYN
jgi:hypothetical protein